MPGGRTPEEGERRLADRGRQTLCRPVKIRRERSGAAGTF